MANIVSSAAHAATQTLAQHEPAPKRSHLIEIIAALLGYRTYAALTAENADPTLELHLEDAEILVLDHDAGIVRARQLITDETAIDTVVTACAEALRLPGARYELFVGIEDFYDSHAREALADTIYNSDEVAAAMSESNASFPNEPWMDVECPKTEDLWSANGEWTISAQGVMKGKYDPDGDRMFNGDTLNCSGALTYRKAGRAGLVFSDSDGTGGADDRWRDADREDEARYWAEQAGVQPR